MLKIKNPVFSILAAMILEEPGVDGKNSARAPEMWMCLAQSLRKILIRVKDIKQKKRARLTHDERSPFYPY